MILCVSLQNKEKIHESLRSRSFRWSSNLKLSLGSTDVSELHCNSMTSFEPKGLSQVPETVRVSGALYSPPESF